MAKHFRLLSDYVNPIVYDFWSRMQRAYMLDLALKCAAVNLTGDGQACCSFFL